METLTQTDKRENSRSSNSQMHRQSEQPMAYIMDIYVAGKYHLPGARLLPLLPSPSRALRPDEFDACKVLRRDNLTPEDIASFPKTLDLTDNGVKSVPDFLYISAFEGLVLSQKARAILEALVPATYTFVALDHSKLPKFARDAGYSFLILTTVLDAVDATRSALMQSNLATQMGIQNLQFTRPNIKCTVRNSIINGHHIWSNRRPVVGSHIFVSDQLKDAWDAAGCGPMQYLPCEEID